ncbi:MAG TPA: ribosome maturation factor RimM [Oculatellaceae cyanobacterium]|jgi:16S rRNA processing protein RimM
MVQEKVRVGKIVGCHGVRGDVKVRPTSREAEWAVAGATLSLRDEKSGRELSATVQSARHHGNLVILHVQGLENRTEAETWIGSTLYASLSDLSPPGEDEYWVDDLIGLSVLDAETGRIRGTVKDVLSSTGTEFLEITLEESSETVVIPFNRHFFPVVDLENKTVTIDLLSDFLSIASKPVTADRLEQ